MFWHHKKPLVICIGSAILIGLLVLGLFAFAEVRTFYSRLSGEQT